MKMTNRLPRIALALLALALVTTVLLSLVLTARAAPIAPAHDAARVLLVPTPITTPSSLDALSLTSNLTVGGNFVLTGTFNGIKCYRGQQSVLGSATAIPATLTAVGITTPAWANESFAAAPGNTYWQKAHINAGGVVTFTVYQNMLSGTVTPQAATTAVALDYEICGQ